MTTSPAAVEAATARGHQLAWDLPAVLTLTRRWTCTRCGRAVLLGGSGVAYGSAVDTDCTED